MVLFEVVSALAPDWYAETNAGAASYPLADDRERRFGVRGFLQWASGDSAVELAVHLWRVGVPIACCYGYDEPHRRFWLPDLVGAEAPGQLWAVNDDGSSQPNGFLGDAITPGRNADEA